MKLKERIYKKCPKCHSTIDTLQEESFGCDYCTNPIDDKLHPKQKKYPEILDLTVFWKDDKTIHYHLCSWNCLSKFLKRLIKKEKDIDFISLPICSFYNPHKGQTPKDLIKLFKEE